MHKLALAIVDEAIDQLVRQLLELGDEPLDVAGGEGGVDELAQAYVLGALLVEDDVRPPRSPVTGDAVVLRPPRAALDQALVIDERIDLGVAQHGEPIGRPGVGPGFARGTHKLGTDGKGRIVDVEERQFRCVDGGQCGRHAKNSTL